MSLAYEALIVHKNPNDYTTFLYIPKLVPCLSSASGAMSTSASIPQNFAYRNDNGRHLVYWVRSDLPSIKTTFLKVLICVCVQLFTHVQSGSSTATTYQGYCETGLLGYFQWLPNGYPRVGTNNRVQYVCNADWENAVTAAELI